MSHICLLAERQGSHMGEGRAGFKLKIALGFQESGGMVAETVFFYSISTDIQNHFHSNKTSSKVQNSGMNATRLVWGKTGPNPSFRQTTKAATRLISRS